MAWVSGKWLERNKRAELIETYAEYINAIETKFDGSIDDIFNAGLGVDYRDRLAELRRLERIHRCEDDLLFFTYEYFSDGKNPLNEVNLIPEGQSYEDAAEFHRVLCGLLDDVAKGNTQTNVAWSVGRRHAKTAYLSNAFLCHQVVFRKQKYIVEVSETTDVAGDFVKFTSQNLKFNEKLRSDFGELLHPKASANEVDNKLEFITTTGTKVEAKGMGTQMRGLRHLTERVGLFLLDDLESNANTNTPELRSKNLQWFRSEMMEALGFGGMCIYMGTILGPDSLLNHVITQRKDFISRKFPAILEWTEREDLWDVWREIYNSDSPDALTKSEEFYEANKDEMLKGTKTLWPQMYSYKYFMEKRETMGGRAFNQEYLGNPTDPDSQIFKPEEFAYFYESDLEGMKIDYYAAVDFAMGKEKGDYSAIVTLARNRETGVCYIVDTFIERVHPDILLNTVVQKALQYQYAGIAVEAQMAQEWFAHKVKEELHRHGYPGTTRVKEVKQRVRKTLRIEALLPDIQNGKIRFSKKHRLLIEQLELYPNARHDDGPDSLSMCFQLAQSLRKIEVQNKPSWL
ncbi:phage terminase large subunit [Psychrobacillus sp. OK032]|uniref:phage terminase large subunit n=1 Tax=Psychrobacillus sp. OK032 TaxID=1884358 RepID=UPI0008B87ECA|nr:phage terminase large subunit [Psychrobacillus sp. OK032]SER87529.1 phage uncharacterized protein (putative large terminase), C-terminal domain-containing protein [Psychrobacillus sp. OK032]